MTAVTTTMFSDTKLRVISLYQNSPSELWKAYALKFLDSYSYFSLSLIFTLFVSHDFGLSDLEAGTLYGLWGACITVYGLLTGWMVDRLGVSASLKLGFLTSLLSRIGIFLTTSKFWLYVYLLGPLPFANCLGIPVLTIGVRRYTQEETRGFAFGLFYVVMNVAALLSGPAVDFCTIAWGKGEKDEAALNDRDITGTSFSSWKLSGYRLVILTGIVSNLVAVLITLTVREIKVLPSSQIPPPPSDDDMDMNVDHIIDDDNNPYQSSTPPSTFSTRSTGEFESFTPIKSSAWVVFQDTICKKRFWRFLAVCFITLNVRMIFRHLDATWPKYMVREFGDSVPKGTLYSINPAMIIVLVPIVTAATSKYDPLLMIHHGSYISSLSVFSLVLSTTIWSSSIFVILLSLGEAVWSPRLYDYTMSICPEGKEGTYMALGAAPLFLAKLPVGMMSGWLLEKYCPEEGERHSQTMWLIIGLMTLSSPVCMTIFWKYISYKDPPDVDDNRDGVEMESHGTLSRSSKSAVLYTEVKTEE